MENEKKILDCLYEMFDNIEPSVIFNIYSELKDFDKTVEFLVEINETVDETGNDILFKMFLEDMGEDRIEDRIEENINSDSHQDRVQNETNSEENWFKNYDDFKKDIHAVFVDLFQIAINCWVSVHDEQADTPEYSNVSYLARISHTILDLGIFSVPKSIDWHFRLHFSLDLTQTG